MIWFIGVWTTVHEISAIKISKKDADTAEIYQSSSTSNSNISETVSHSITNDNTFWKCVTRPFRCIYVNCFNRLRDLAEFSTKLHKIDFFGQFKDHKTRKQHGN